MLRLLTNEEVGDWWKWFWSV